MSDSGSARSSKVLFTNRTYRQILDCEYRSNSMRTKRVCTLTDANGVERIVSSTTRGENVHCFDNADPAHWTTADVDGHADNPRSVHANRHKNLVGVVYYIQIRQSERNIVDTNIDHWQPYVTMTTPCRTLWRVCFPPSSRLSCANAGASRRIYVLMLSHDQQLNDTR